MAAPPLSVVIVTHVGGALLAECRASLEAQSRPADEVLVVVSNDAPIEVEKPCLQLYENVGYARAANIGFAATRGDVLLLNDDTRLAADCLERLAAARGRQAVYQPRLLLADGTNRLDNLGHGLFPDGAVWARGRNGHTLPGGAPGGFSGAAVLFPRAVLERVGGFDERFGSFGEDVDLSLRLLRRGIPIVPVPEAVVWHHLGATWGRAPPEKLYSIERNRIRASVRSLPITALLTMPAWTLSRYALYARLARLGRGPGDGVGPEARRAAIAGLVRGLLDVPEWWADRRHDRAEWTRGEWETWRALHRGRARWRDVQR